MYHLYLLLGECRLLGVYIHAVEVALVVGISLAGPLVLRGGGRPMLEELFIHLLAHLTVLLRLYLLDLSIVNTIFVVIH